MAREQLPGHPVDAQGAQVAAFPPERDAAALWEAALPPRQKADEVSEAEPWRIAAAGLVPGRDVESLASEVWLLTLVVHNLGRKPWDVTGLSYPSVASASPKTRRRQ